MSLTSSASNFPRFTASVRVRDELSTSLFQVPLLDVEVMARKRESKKSRMQEKERTVADLIALISANSKPKRQKVSTPVVCEKERA